MKRRLAVIGLGYVGLPVAVAFAQNQKVFGFDIDENRLNALKKGHDHTGEVSPEQLLSATLEFTSQVDVLKQGDFYIVTVPTPVDSSNKPDMRALCHASATVGRVLKSGDIVVYESTVFPGVTEDICIPILEKTSGLTNGKDFNVGYSPERINPGDTQHRFETIRKIVAAQDDATCQLIAEVYETVLKNGTYRVANIKVAEAAKVIENTQRDINIAFMNELALLFHKLGIDTQEVLKAAQTKWNFLPFYPGLVGGHCIGVDPYYLTFKAEQVGYHPQIILAGRRLNDSMGEYIALQGIQKMLGLGMVPAQAQVNILGLTFKENCPDLRNTKVMDIITTLQSFHIKPAVSDPLALNREAQEQYALNLTPLDALPAGDVTFVAVAHKIFKEWGFETWCHYLKKGSLVLDVKGIVPPSVIKALGITLWRL